jgi:hypothetical protein
MNKAPLARLGWHVDQTEWVRDMVLAGSRSRSFDPGEFTFMWATMQVAHMELSGGGFGVLVP